MRMRILVAFLLAVASAQAATHVCDDATRAEVVSKIALTSPGDTVIVPPDPTPRDWSPSVTISGITLQGPGWNAPSTVTVTDGEMILTKHATHYTKLIGFKFTRASGRVLTAGGAASLKAFICESNFFRSDSSHCVSVERGGLFAVCAFAATTPVLTGTGWSKSTDESGSWSASPTLGTLDTTGEANVYFEDCTFTNILQSICDTDVGGRSVIRHSTIVDSSVITHGGGESDGGNDSSTTGGKHTEIYKNTFVRQLASANLNEWVQFRGGGGVIISNEIPSNTSVDYPNKLELELSVGCQTPGYPRPYQIGQVIYSPVDSSPDYPILIFGNTGTGIDDANYLVIGSNPHDPFVCGDPETYIQENRDYYLSNQWGWAPYTYPHPLRSGDAPEPPAEVARVQKLKALKIPFRR